ncbi:MAG: hypothetical protein M3096_08100, partial [Actinomycetia bacterium]|nr:hypothetical protein [Actinomycetes bacterium]
MSILVEVVAVSPSGAGLGEELVVVTDAKDPAHSGCRATVPHRTVPASGTETGLAAGVDRHGFCVRTGDSFGLIVDREIVAGVLIVTEFRVALKRQRFDHSNVFGVFE